MSTSAEFIKWKMSYQITPIILTGGIAAQQAHGLPIVTLTDDINPSTYIARDGSALDRFFANYYPMPGSTLLSNQVAMYPFANQAVAANALIAQPLRVSMVMVCPAGNSTSTTTFEGRRSIVSALQATLSQHNALGGMYTVCTPSYIYTNCVMMEMRDVSSGESKQPQMMYQLDFLQPLITQQAAAQALNGLMQSMTEGIKITGTPSYSQGLPITNPTNTLTSALSQASLA